MFPLTTHVKTLILPCALSVAVVLLWPLGSLAFDPAVSTEFVLTQGSSYCMDCHSKTATVPLHRSHTVDIDYLLAQARSNGRLKPPALLDPAVYLKDGQMVCTSCHHPESRLEAKLVLSNLRSGLCLACHNY